MLPNASGESAKARKRSSRYTRHSCGANCLTSMVISIESSVRLTFVPVHHSQRMQRHPTVRGANLTGQFLVKRVVVSRIEQPPTVLLTTLTNNRDSLVDARVRLHTGRAEVVQRTQYIVAPQWRK